MLTAYAFMIINVLGWILALVRSPFWGLLVYANIYFNPPLEMLNWWAGYLPDVRWSLISTVVVIVSMLIHREKISRRPLGNALWIFVFFGLTTIITYTWALNRADAVRYNNMLFAFCLACYFIIRCIKDEQKLRVFLLVLVGFAAQLSVKAFLQGRRIHARLEYNGTSDAYGSNEFALLLAGILPLTIPFILKGKWYERLLCILALPFLINAFILCNSRGAFVALVLSALLVLVFFPDRQVRKGMLVAVICAIPAFLYLADPYFIERLATLKGSSNITINDPGANELSSGRLEIWGYGLKMVNDHPLGAGPNGFKYLARYYMPAEVLTYHPGEEVGMRAAHNTYLQVLVELGYLGLLFFLIMCYRTLHRLRRALSVMKPQEGTNGFWGYTILALSLSFLSILFGGMFNSRFYYEFFWWQIALIAVTSACLTDREGAGKTEQSTSSS